MAKAAMIRARVEPELKKDVENIFQELGLSITEAITLFYRQVRLNRGLPFEVRIPNETTVRTFQDSDAGRNVIRAETAEEMFEKLGV
ncbi:MAG: type II toxin-antitoxin system RelB/DinJ family antitoxin [Anaerolineales bacterium]|nr:type II toxin-antitoxin system RelB/DinJ family antitoxin [Anaerolineales bacterium]MDO9348667.1 type II toxin-antitoxin system RelB/DinJ family antitoxin [Anaerolineales bacterium]MDP3184653.1 type II toxin-antitoxin system RelB/DinJ family antitoxin [Anaerolineales bacterium]